MSTARNDDLSAGGMFPGQRVPAAMPMLPPPPTSSSDGVLSDALVQGVPMVDPIPVGSGGGAPVAASSPVALGLLSDLTMPSSRVGDVSESMDPSVSVEARSHSLTSWLARGVKNSFSFLVHTARHEWHAAPISFLASFSSNFLTAFSVVACAPWCARVMGGEGTVGYTLATSAAAVLIGYGTYLAGYYGMMAYKEQASSRAANRPFDTKEFLRVVALDFTLHLPNDLFTMTKTGAFQVGLLASGTANLFWSVLVSQMVVDLLYCPKEAVYWSLAKTIVRRRNQGVSDTLAETLLPANQDALDLPDDKRQSGNE